MGKYIDFVLDRPIVVLVLMAVLTILLGSGMTRLHFDSSPDVMMPKKDSRYLFNEEVKKIYGNVGKFIIMDLSGKNIWTKKYFQDMDNLVTDLEEYQNYDKKREDERLHQFDQIVSRGSIDTSDLIKMFKLDPPFQRDIVRIISKQLQGVEELDNTHIAKLRNMLVHSHELKKQSLIDSIVSPMTAKDISGKDDTLTPVALIEIEENGRRVLPETAEDFNEFKMKLQKNPAFLNTIYSREKTSGNITDISIVVRLTNIKKEEDIANKIWDITSGYPDLNIIQMGLPVVNKFVNEYMRRDLRYLIPLMMLVMLIVFYLNFRSLRGVFLPFVALVITDVWVLGLMGHLGINITVIGVSLPTLMIAVGSSYSIHILNQYYIDFNDITRIGKRQGLDSSMFHISQTVLLAGLTTFIGFLSLQTNQVVGIREWGLFSAIGVLFAVFISITIIPAGLMLMAHKKSFTVRSLFGSSNKTWIDPLISFFIAASTKHHRKVLAVTGVVLVLSIIGLLKIEVETSIMAYFKQDDYISVSNKAIGEKFGGSVGICVLIDSGEVDGIMDPEYLDMVDDFREWLIAEENRNLNVGRTIAFTDILKSMHMAMNNDQMAYYKIPPTREEIMDYLEIFSGEDENSDGRIDAFESFVDQDFRTSMIFVKLWEKEGHSLGTGAIRYTQDRISDYLNKRLPETYSFRIAGEPTIFVALSDYVVKGQLYSLIFCLIAVSLVVVLLFKNWQAGFLSLIPMGVAVLINFGIMGWFGIALDTATAIIASVAIGIGVDDTIHFLNTFRYFRLRNLSTDEAIKKTLEISGKAITYTSLALVFGFLVMTISNFKPLILLGILNALTMVGTTIGALIILPAAIKAARVNLDESKSDSWFWRLFYLGRFFNLVEE